MSLLPTHRVTLISTPTTSTSATRSPRTVRPAVILPGLANNTGDYRELVSSLKETYGIPSVVTRVSRFDWFRNATGLVDINYWRGTFSPRPLLDWYLERVDEAVAEAKQLLEEGGSVSLIGHSAGGWLARLYLEEFGTENISLLLTLGSPHLPPPKGLPGVIDQTRGLLDYVQNNCSPAVYTPELKYVCIAGRFIQGTHLIVKPRNTSESSILADKKENGRRSLFRKTNINSKLASLSLHDRFAGQSYKQVCGRADVWGDGIVPEVSSHLEGALNISLDGVYHSPFGSDDTKPWYGSPSVLDKWVHHLLT